MPYFISHSELTCAEPSSGWFYLRENDDGNETIVGPFATKAEALDDESDGAYSSYLESKREDRDEYERDMRDAGRGHLLRGDE